MLAKLASAYSHKIAAKLISLGAEPPAEQITSTARSEEHGLMVVVTICRYDGPMTVSPSVLEKIAAFSASQGPETGATKCPTRVPPRRDVETCILEAAPGQTDRPVSIKQLATRAGYRYTLWFREAVNSLVIAGELVRTSQGVRLAG